MKRRMYTIQFVGEPEAPGERVVTAKGAADLAVALWHKFFNWDQEHFVVLFLNARGRITGHQLVSMGTLTASLVHPRETFRAAIAANAAQIIVVHNHPSGEVAPSDDDLTLTKRLREAGDIIGIPVVDSLVITRAGAFASCV